MYRYDEHDRKIIAERVAQFRDQTRRFLAGELSEDEFRPLRLQNGLYIQRHAPMYRIAVPYGVLGSRQLRKLAAITRRYDRSYGHFTTRHNLQLNWPRLEDIPDILAELAEVEMHSVQTSGNDVRNITTDHFAGIAADEIADPRPYAEIVRQWASFHPEFAYLPRKFKIAVNASAEDRTVLKLHDIGLELRRNDAGELGFRVHAGGGMGRTPILAEVIRDFVPWRHVLTYCESILRVYNRYGRRDNIWKARIKILVKTLGVEEFRARVEEDWAELQDSQNVITDAEYARVAAHFAPPAYEPPSDDDQAFAYAVASDRAFARWVGRNVHAHKRPGYAAVTLSLKRAGTPPGDITADEMDLVADLADRYGFGEVRVTHEQNLVLPDVRERDLHDLWQRIRGARLATPTVGLVGDIISCPGGDLCSLANAKTLPIAEALLQRFEDLDYQHDVGELDLNISGCMNSCGHHHVGHIGILGVDKNGSEWYQVTIGGRQGREAALGHVIGPSFAAAQMPEVVEKLIATYLEHRVDAERFVDTVERIGIAPFKTRVYGAGKELARAA
ncbi:MAG TPA: nitrite/sulfite reductase [Usitatibacter sp.]|jgi:sulfite reductase (NADPH) hemoprotein beta-component|nr:nitrite/sulfite reductase [Usitatibacter sp.]